MGSICERVRDGDMQIRDEVERDADGRNDGFGPRNHLLTPTDTQDGLVSEERPEAIEIVDVEGSEHLAYDGESLFRLAHD